MVNNAVESTTGNVVCIEKGTKLIHEISNKVRLIDTITYSIDDAEKLYGFVCGILASNYDISDLFIDSAFKICCDSVSGFEEFVRKVLPLLDDINLTVTASIEPERVPESLKPYLA